MKAKSSKTAYKKTKKASLDGNTMFVQARVDIPYHWENSEQRCSVRSRPQEQALIDCLIESGPLLHELAHCHHKCKHCVGGHSVQNGRTMKESTDAVQWAKCFFPPTATRRQNEGETARGRHFVCRAHVSQVATARCCFSGKAERPSRPLSTESPPATLRPPWSGPTSSPRASRILWTPMEWAPTGRSTLVSSVWTFALCEKSGALRSRTKSPNGSTRSDRWSEEVTWWKLYLSINLSTVYLYVYIYIYICVCVQYLRTNVHAYKYTYIHTHTCDHIFWVPIRSRFFFIE